MTRSIDRRNGHPGPGEDAPQQDVTGPSHPLVHLEPVSPTPALTPRPRPASERRPLVPAYRAPRESVIARFAVLALVVGLLLGTGIGALLGGLTSDEARATALVALTPTAVDSGGASVSADQQRGVDEQFAQSELAWISGGALGIGVEQALALPEIPDVTADRVGQSLTGRFSASATSEDEAMRLLRSAVEVYSAHRAAQADDRARTRLTAIDQGLGTLLTIPRPDVGTQERIGELQKARARVLIEQAGEASGPSVLTPPTPDAASGIPRLAMGIVVGGLAGALIGLVALAAWRTRTRRLVERSDLDGVGRVLHPDVRPAPLSLDTSKVRGRRIRETRRRTARLLLAQVVHRPTVAGRTIVVIGTTRGSDSGRVARILAEGAAEHAPARTLAFGASTTDSGLDDLGVDTVILDEPVGSSAGALAATVDTVRRHRDAAEAEGCCLVVDAGSTEDSGLPLAVLALATDVVLVARRFHDHVSDVEAADVMLQRSVETPAVVMTVRKPSATRAPAAPVTPGPAAVGAEPGASGPDDRR